MAKKESNKALTLKDLEETLTKYFKEYTGEIIEAVDFGFEKAKEDRKEIKDRLASLERKVTSLERRAIHIEDVITRHTKEIKIIKTTLAKHSKELKEIKKDLKELKSQKEPLEERVNLLEERVTQLEQKYL